MAKHVARNPIFWITWLVRIFGGLLVFYDPFWGSLLIFHMDNSDSYIVTHILGLNREDYYKVDKIVDWINNTEMLLASITLASFLPLLLLFVYRLIGYIVSSQNS